MVYLAIALAMVDLFRALNGRLRLFYPFADNPFRQVMGALLVLLAVSGIIYFGWLNALNPIVTKYNVDIHKESGTLDKLKIVMVSDIHLGNVVHNGRLQKLVDIINEQKPDIVLLPGDIVNENPDAFIKQNMNLSIKEISTRYGIYAVPGNHDYIGGKSEKIFSLLQKAGVNVLRDRSVLVANSFFLVGEDEKSHQPNNNKS
ncbi:MAG: metallophosphoesterase, partial [Peptococcaceae bacterium]|nr:metallophosphoesterase [Peptococcaceae bacterium]